MVVNINSSEQSRVTTAATDLLARGLRLAWPLGEGSALPDPKAAGFASPDPWVCAPPRLTPGFALRLTWPLAVICLA